MKAKQAKQIWERRYNVIVTIERDRVNVIALDDLTQCVNFQFVPPMMGEKTSWFDWSSGERIRQPGWTVRRMALAAKKGE